MQKIIGQMHAGAFCNFGRNAVDCLGDRARDAGKRIRIAAETVGRPHCAFPVRRLECGGQSRRDGAHCRHVKTAAAKGALRLRS